MRGRHSPQGRRPRFRLSSSEHFQFEMRSISNHTACRFAEKARWGRDGGLGGRDDENAFSRSAVKRLGPPAQAATERRPAGPCPLATQEPYGHRQQSATERRPKAVPVATKEATGIDSRARPKGGPQGRARWRRRSLTGIDSNARGSPFPPKKTGQLRPWFSFFSAATMAASAGRKGRVDASSGSIQRRVCPSRLEGCPSKAVTWKKCRRTWRPRSG